MARTYLRGTWRAETQDGRPIPHAQASVWDAADGGQQVTDLRTLEGAPVPGGLLECDAWGYISLPGFVDPAETPSLHIIGAPDGIIPGVGRVHLVPADTPARVTSLETQHTATAETVAYLADSRGQAGGIATLDATGRLTESQWPPGGGGGGGMTGVHDVRLLGADPGGEDDATGAIQGALTACRDASGGTVWVPGGVYSIQSGPLRIYRRTRLVLAPDAVIRRDAPGTMLLNGDAGQDLGGYSGHGDLIIEGGTWDANGVQVPTANMVLSIGHARNITIRDCRLLDVPSYHAIEVNSTETCRIERVTCAGFVDAVGDRGFSEAIQLDGAFRQSVFGGFGPYDGTPCRDILITGCTVTNSDTPGSGPWGRGIGSHSAVPDQQHHDIRVIGNHIEATREYAVGAYIWRDCVITGNTIRGCGAGVWVRALDSSKSADRTRPDGSTITGSQGLSGIVITNNVLNATGNLAGAPGTSVGAIIVEGETTGIISEVVIGDNVVDVTDTVGLRISNVENYSIARNVLNAIDNTAISQLSTRAGLIADNAINGPTGSGISVDSRQLASGVGTHVSVHRNQISSAGSNGVHVLGGVDLTLTDNRVNGAASYGFQISSGAEYFTATGNRVTGTGAAGLNVTSACHYAKVFGNVVRGSGGGVVVPSTDSDGQPTNNSTTADNQNLAA